VSLASGSHQVITCLVCEEKIPTWHGDIRVECAVADVDSSVDAIIRLAFELAEI
jgi:hypothetical protein